MPKTRIEAAAEPQSRSREEWALEMAERGLLVFPLRPGSKEPYGGESWVEMMTADPDQIRAWFEHRERMNYGVCPGGGYVVVDLDKKAAADGEKALAALQSREDPEDWVMGVTLTVRTPSSGLHLYLSIEEPASNSHLFPAGVDVRGARGYVVGPGCEVGGKAYTVENDSPVAPAPYWIWSKLRTGRKRTDDSQAEPLFDLDDPEAVEKATRFLRQREPAIEGLGGNDHTYATACLVKDSGISEGRAVELMLESWNERCEPPWLADELAGVVANAYRYGASPPGKRGGGNVVELFGEPAESGARDVADMQAEPSPDAGEEDGDIYPAYLESELDAIPDPSWLIRDCVPENALTMTYGATGSLKTFLELDAALCGAAGMPWAGSDKCGIPGFEVARPLRVAILAGEGARGLKRRVAAWKRRHRVTDALPVLIVPVLPPFADLAAVKKIERTVRTRLGSCDLLIVDTAMRAASGLNMNLPADSQILIDRCDHLRRSLACTVTLVHHTGKDRERGHLGAENLIAAVDSVRRVELAERSQGRRVIRVTYEKMKDSDLPDEPICMAATVERLGDPFEGDGPDVSSLVLERCHGTSTAKGGGNPYLECALEIIGEHEGRSPLAAKALAGAIVDRMTTADLTDGEHERDVSTCLRWLQRAAKQELAEHAWRDGKSRTSPWYFGGRRLGATGG